MSDYLSLFNQFLESLPDDIEWMNFSQNAKFLIKRECIRRYAKKINFNIEKVNALYGKIANNLDVCSTTIRLNIENYKTVSSIIESDPALGREPRQIYGFLDNNKFLRDWFNYDSQTHERSGVYLIGNFYVGQSTNIRERLLRHARAAVNFESSTSVNLYAEIRKNFSNGQAMPVTVLSNDIDHEQFFIDLCSDVYGFELKNSAYGRGGMFCV